MACIDGASGQEIAFTNQRRIAANAGFTFIPYPDVTVKGGLRLFIPLSFSFERLTLSLAALAFGFIRLVFLPDTPGCGFNLCFGTQFKRVDSAMFRTAPDNIAVSRMKPFPANFALTAR